MVENGVRLVPLLAFLLLSCLLLPCPCRAFVAVAVEGYGRGRVIRSVDSGASWTTVVEAYIDLHAVATPSPYSVVAVGANGTIVAAGPNATLPATLATAYSNASIDASAYLSSPVPAYSSYYPGSYSSLVSQYGSLAVQTNTTAAPSSLNSSVSQYYSTFATPPHDTVWTPTSLAYVYATVSPPSTDDFRAVAFLSPLLGVAAGTTGTVYRSVDGGWSWSSVSSGIIRDLNALAFAFSSSGGWTLMAAGNVGTVLLSLDTGLSWQPLNLSTTDNLYGVALYSPTQAVVCGDEGALLSTSDGGNVWSNLSQPQWVNVSFHSVAYHNASTLYIAASRSTLLVSRDGGYTLTRVPMALNEQLVRFDGLFLTPTVVTVAARSRLYAAYLSGSASSAVSAAANTTGMVSGTWSPLTAAYINRISSVAVLEAGVLTIAVPSFNLSAYLGLDLPFNVTLTNTGTDTLTVTAFTSDDALIVFSPATTTLSFPLTLAPFSAAVVLDFVYAASRLSATSTTAYISNLTLLTTSPSQRARVFFSLYLLPSPSSSSPSFLSQYWYVLALSLGVVAVLLVVFVRRRLRYVRRWNRRVLYEDEKIRFWGCWLLSQDIEHDSDSEFWSDDSERDEAGMDDAERGSEGEGEGERDDDDEDGLDGEEYGESGQHSTDERDKYGDNSSVNEHKEAHRHKQQRHQLVLRDEDDDGWDDDEEDDEEGRAGWQDGQDEADEENTDSSISDPDDFFYQPASSARRRAPSSQLFRHQEYNDGDYARHRGASRTAVHERGTVHDNRRQHSFTASSGDDAPATMHGRRSSVLMADVARLAAAARHNADGGHHGH